LLRWCISLQGDRLAGEASLVQHNLSHDHQRAAWRHQAVIYDNTALLSKVYEQKVAAGNLDAIAFIQGMSPVAW
jgi:hypothetical protein